VIIRDVVTVGPDMTVAELLSMMEEHGIKGFPVVEDGGELQGIVTWRDVRLADSSLRIRDVMTEEVVTGNEDTEIDEAMKILHEHRIEKLPIVDKDNRVQGLITMKDITLKGTFKEAVRDEQGRLLCAAAISPFVDVSHFHNKNCFDATKKVLKEVSADVIVGNIGTYQAAEDIITQLDGVAGLRVGIGSGSICSTSIVTRAGAPTLFATSQVADAVKDYESNIPIIADGGMRNPYYKEYYGMGSAKARQKRFAQDRYSQPSKSVNEGVEGWVPFRGPVKEILDEFTGGLKAAMGYVGAATIPDWRSSPSMELETLHLTISSAQVQAGPSNFLYTTL